MPERQPKLPVPGPWQAAVLAARSDLAHRLTVAQTAIAVTRVEPDVEIENRVRADRDAADASSSSESESILSVWLLTGGETFRYRVVLDNGMPSPRLVSGADWMLAGS